MQELTYSAAMTELESIVRQLQQSDTEVDRLCALTSRAVELIAFCRARLTTTDEQLAKILEALDD